MVEPQLGIALAAAPRRAAAEARAQFEARVVNASREPSDRGSKAGDTRECEDDECSQQQIASCSATFHASTGCRESVAIADDPNDLQGSHCSQLAKIKIEEEPSRRCRSGGNQAHLRQRSRKHGRTEPRRFVWAGSNAVAANNKSYR